MITKNRGRYIICKTCEYKFKFSLLCARRLKTGDGSQKTEGLRKCFGLRTSVFGPFQIDTVK